MGEAASKTPAPLGCRNGHRYFVAAKAATSDSLLVVAICTCCGADRLYAYPVGTVKFDDDEPVQAV